MCVCVCRAVSHKICEKIKQQWCVRLHFGTIDHLAFVARMRCPCRNVAHFDETVRIIIYSSANVKD